MEGWFIALLAEENKEASSDGGFILQQQKNNILMKYLVIFIFYNACDFYSLSSSNKKELGQDNNCNLCANICYRMKW